MQRPARLLISFLTACSLCAATVAEDQHSFSAGDVLFAVHVQPLLVQKCFACHGDDPARVEGELSLASRSALLRGGESGETILQPGNAAGSLLFRAVNWNDPSCRMPPKEADRLSEEQVWRIRDWIDAGAPWPDAETITAILAAHETKITVPTSGGLSDDWTRRRYDPEDLWAYRPLIRGEEDVERVSQGGASLHPIDVFINQRLGELELTAAPPADRRMLIRRATYDLLGLPPTPAEVEAFANDPATDAAAFEKVLDRLLASPYYGEQWGRRWLDVVRYADSSGFSNDYERPNAWRYRDYVVRAFNADKPYDRFVREQLAGDELDPDDPELLIAVGFLRMGPWEQTGMSVAKETRQQFLDDVTDTVGQVFLSHPLQCCRCHDHKFDPIPTRDYYRMQAVFASTQFADRPAPFLPDENLESFDAERPYLEERIDRYRKILQELVDREEANARVWYAERGLEYAPRPQKLRQNVPQEELAPRYLGLTVEDRGMERIARKYLQRHEWEMDKFAPIAFSVTSGMTRTLRNVAGRIDLPADPLQEGDLERTAILAGGDVYSPTEPVSPGGLSCVGAMHALDGQNGSEEADERGEDADESFRVTSSPLLPFPSAPHLSSPLRSDFTDDVSGRRRQLADWITDPRNPLTARSIVNRIWQGHFGQGIVRTPNNFGKMGKKPTHPELLDWLAVRFMNDGWSIKTLHRLIMTSDAYRRSSIHPDMPNVLDRDPELLAYAVFRPRRLTAEELRDSLLAVSGELNRELGGLPVRPDINREVALQPRQIMGTYAPTYQASPLPSQRHRRSLYAVQIRGLRDPFMEVFNQPGSETPCDLREASTIAPQAFALLNAETSYDRALALATRLLEEESQELRADGREEESSKLRWPATVLRRAFLLAYGREPALEETAACLDHWKSMTERHRSITIEQPKPPIEITRRAVEEMSGETFELAEELETHREYVPDRKFADVDPRTRGLAEVCLVLMNSNEFVYVP